VLERDSEPGGQLRWGIPSFALPRELVARPWKALQEAGVVVWCNVEATPDRLPGLRSRFDAVVMAYGAWVPRGYPFEGDQLVGVWDAARFLRAGGEALAGGTDLPAMLGRPRTGIRQPTVLVVGAGDTGLEVSRLAVRLGARAVCVGRSDREATAARPERVVAAEREGVDIRFRTALVRAESTQGWVDSVVLVRTGRDGRPATGGRSGSGAQQVVDLVVVAQGSRPDPVWDGALPGTAARRNRAGAPEADDPLPDWQACGLVAFDGVRQRGRTEAGAWVGEQSLRRERAARRAAVPVHGRVWVVGDAFTGAATVVEAMAAGRRAAQEILRRGRNRVP
jgi:NADPH-dependent glutamate synthase beta subunit-like oxidoreductase